MSAAIFLNGEFMAPEAGKVSVLDRGFMFGDGVYEVIPVYARAAFRLDGHLRRLQRSLDEIRLSNPYSAAEWTRLIGELIARNLGDDQSVYLQVTRGAMKRDFGLPQGLTPTVFMMSNALALPSREQVENGVAAITATDFRWLKCQIKSISLLGANMLRQLAIDAGAAECVLLREGYLTEGSSSNVFVVSQGRLLMPPRDHLILPGITYDVVEELAQAHGVAHEVREVSEHEVKRAQELMLGSSSREILALTKLDGKPVGEGKPGPVFRRLYALFQDYKASLARKPQQALV
jgi:D-alanine transaminase